MGSATQLADSEGRAYRHTSSGIPVKGVLMGPQNEDGNGSVLTVSATATTSASIVAEAVDLLVTNACFIRISNAAAVTAAVNDYYMAAETTYRFPITPNSRISAIRVASDGSLYIHPVNTTTGNLP